MGTDGGFTGVLRRMTCPRNLVARADWDETDWNDHVEEELASTDGPTAAAAHTDDGSARRVCFPYRYIVFSYRHAVYTSLHAAILLHNT